MPTLVEIIEQNLSRMTPRQRRIAEFVLVNPLLAATMGIEELAQGVGTSPASITRFVRLLGLPGFAEFRALAVQGYRTLLQPIERQDRARGRSIAELSHDCSANAAQLAALTGAIDPATWAAIADRLLGARSVGVMGFGLGAALAGVLADMLGPFTRSQALLNGAGGGERVAQAIQRMGPDDALVAISLRRYSVATVDFLRLARARGVFCIALTDAEDSPLVPLSDIRVVLPAAHPVLHSSVVGMVTAFEMLRAILVAHHQTPTEAVALTGLLVPYLHTDDAGAQHLRPGRSDGHATA